MVNSERKDLLTSIIHDRVKQISSKTIGLSRDSKHYFNKKIYNVEDGVKHLMEGVVENKPYLVGRFGTSECAAWVRYERIRLLKYKNYGKCRSTLCNNAGFFPDDVEYINKYCELLFDLLPEIDLLCTMNTVGESYIVKQYCQNAKLTLLPVVDPCITGWTKVLEGKKVLVIHPMTDTIRLQYENNRNKIFVGTDILPKFDLLTIKSVQTIAGNLDERFSDWFQALDYMFEQAISLDFDVALIGCGAYGLPLAAKLKRVGKTAIHLGGCLQLLFGIFGSRWVGNSYVEKYYNKAWVRPGGNEKPNNSDSIENGCYW
ncbi:hypothetical protein [Eubacterium sp.]|uniref:hypothetical protein n=1 Tax=Eubacterium sp. TaxID=142586 RepID=UPI0025D69EEB|nr:hypothetical protein [Eubacterium sp.]MCR5629812.1 hypothetical protein [Eubacterium sp.]